jgi:hypothetical protein
MLLLVGSCADANQDPVRLYRAPPLATTVDGVEWRTGNWEPHLPAGEAGTSWGNHRAVVVNDGSPGASAVRVTIPWRRHDVDPASKSIVVVDAETGERVWNVVVERVERASGDVVFQPNQGSSIYHVYYMPWESTGSYYPTVTYPDDLTDPADPAWAADAATTELPRARTVRIESVDDFHSFFPMEITATEAEAAAFLDGAPGGWTVVPEHRDRPLRMRRFIPEHWARQGRSDLFESQVLRDEAFTFQLALVAGNAPLTDVRVSFQGFPAEWQETLTCFNCAGIDRSGVPFEKDVSVPAGEVLPLWIGIRVPTDQDPGTIEGTVTVSARDRGEQSVRVSLVVLDGNAPNGGTDEPDLVTRLAWLDSTAGDDPDFIIEPFEPVELVGYALTILGRRVELAETGLPERILSFFTPELTGFAEQPEPILARPLELILTVGGETEVFASEPFEVGQESRGSANWTAESVSERFRMTVAGRLEYDGMLDYRIALVALADVEVDDVSLPVHYAPTPTRQRRLELGDREPPGGRLAGCRPQRAPVRSPRQQLCTPPEHELLSKPAAPDAAVLVQRWAGWDPDPRDRGRGRGGQLLGSSHGERGRHAQLQPPAADHPVQADRYRDALRDPLRAPVRPGRFRPGVGRNRRQHPPRQRDQPVHQLPLLRSGRTGGLHRRGARQGDQGQALQHDPGAHVQGARAVCASQPGR